MSPVPIGSLLRIQHETPPPPGLTREAMNYWLTFGGGRPSGDYEYRESLLTAARPVQGEPS